MICLVLASAGVAAGDLAGEVIAIADGDTFRLLTPDKKQVRVRLAAIDTPEQGQPYSARARQALSDLVFRRDVRVKVIDTDRYGRTVGRVFVGDLDVNAELVRRGAAWVYRKYADDESLYRLEAEARAARRGIWSLPEAQRVPPWEWRNGKRNAEPVASRSPSSPDFVCGAKTYCREMHSCAEAKFHFEQCGLTRIDGDGDGRPCETLCR